MLLPLKICFSAFGICVSLLVGYGLTQIAWQPERVTPETFPVTEPRLANGDVDYFSALMTQHYSDLRKHPEKNGFPRIKKRMQDEKIIFPADEPERENWVAEHEAFLDELSEAVKEPYFLPEWKRPEGLLFNLNFCDENETQIKLARMLEARVKRSVKAGDPERAIDALLALYLLGRKVGQGPGLVPLTVETGIESMAQSRLKELLDSKKVTVSQLNRLEAGLASLPAPLTLSEIQDRNQFIAFDALQRFLHAPFTRETADSLSAKESWLRHFIDKNIVREYFYRKWRALRAIESEPDPQKRQKQYELFEKNCLAASHSRSTASLFFLRGRSEYCGAMALALLIPSENYQLDAALRKSEAAFQLVCLSVRLERFRLQKTEFPAASFPDGPAFPSAPLLPKNAEGPHSLTNQPPQ